MAPIGVNVLIVEPRALQLFVRHSRSNKSHTEGCKTVKTVFDIFETVAAQQKGDPTKAEYMKRYRGRFPGRN